MEYITIPASSKKFFVLFHGTGGNEYSLLSVAGDIDPHASIISFLGNEGTGENRRYFQPLSQGKLPRENFNQKVDEFLTRWDTLKPSNSSVTFIGYSNGANFILGLLEKRPDLADNIILLHPSNLGYEFPSGSDKKILLTSGATDTLSSPGETLKLAEQITQQFPNTKMELLDTGHEVTSEEIERISHFLN